MGYISVEELRGAYTPIGHSVNPEDGAEDEVGVGMAAVFAKGKGAVEEKDWFDCCDNSVLNEFLQPSQI